MTQAGQSRGLFITGTGTDIGKTYVTALLIKALRDTGLDCGYYKAAVSGASSIAASDAGYVNRISGIGQAEETLLSYLYQAAVSPHLAAQLEGNPLSLAQVQSDYQRVGQRYPYVVVEGSGGIVCPLRWDQAAQILLEDVIKGLNLPTVIIADAGLGTINATVLTIHYLQSRQLPILGVILNQYTDDPMQADNKAMIEALTGIPVLATVAPNAKALALSEAQLRKLFQVNQ